MFLYLQISILEWFLKVMLKIQLCIGGINYILKYIILIYLFHNITVFNIFFVL